MVATKRTRKKIEKEPANDPLDSFPSTTSWYSIEQLFPPDKVWCLVWSVDTDGDNNVHLARWDPQLKAWLNPTNTAIEASESISVYSPIFDPAGKLWRLE